MFALVTDLAVLDFLKKHIDWKKELGYFYSCHFKCYSCIDLTFKVCITPYRKTDRHSLFYIKLVLQIYIGSNLPLLLSHSVVMA